MSLKSFHSIDTGYSRERRARVAWLKANLAAAIADGHMPDEADIGELPAPVWGIVRALAKRGVDAHTRGERPEARLIAEELVAEVDARLDDKWTPPHEKPDRDLVDEIAGRQLFR